LFLHQNQQIGNSSVDTAFGLKQFSGERWFALFLHQNQQIGNSSVDTAFGLKQFSGERWFASARALHIFVFTNFTFYAKSQVFNRPEFLQFQWKSHMGISVIHVVIY
jgi:hypothetical protein